MRERHDEERHDEERHGRFCTISDKLSFSYSPSHLREGGGGCNVMTGVYTLFKPTLASGNSCEVSGDSPAVG